MRREMVMRGLGVLLAMGCAAAPVRAQTESTGSDRSVAGMAQEAANPFANSWLLQMQQNNNWIDLPRVDDSRVQSNFTFQPLMNVRLTEKLPLFIRPMMTMVNSLPGV